MRKLLVNKGLRSIPIRSAPPRGFSLVELVVSMGILIVMLTLSGQVLKLTVDSTGQAMALTEVNQALRVFEQNLREDLRAVDRDNSVMVIQGNAVNAYWTRDEKEADDDGDPSNNVPLPRVPRADLLMFFTTRKATNYVRYAYKGFAGVAPATTSNLQQVVYGHAGFGEWIADPARGYQFEEYPQMFPAAPAPMPANTWHLARRGILLRSEDPPSGVQPHWASIADSDSLGCAVALAGGGSCTSRLLRAETDIMGNFNYEAQVLTPGASGPFFLPRIFDDGEVNPFARSLLDETPPPLLADRLGHYFLPQCASFKVEWALDPQSEFVDGRLDGEKQIFWFDPGAPNDDYEDQTKGPLASLGRARAQEEAVYGDSPRHTRLNELLTDPLGGVGTYSLADRFGGARVEWMEHPYVTGGNPRPNLAVFLAKRRITTGAPTVIPEDVFPAALRITVEMFDDESRLARPVRHVMVVPVGE